MEFTKNSSQTVAQDKLISVVGAGLAGSECAWQLAQMGYSVALYEMRGKSNTAAHKTENFAELVCSNSFGSMGAESGPGQLKWEAGKMNSLILQTAMDAHVPAGQALGVDREKFSQWVTEKIQSHPRIKVHREKIERLDQIPRPVVLATGPLTDENLAADLQKHFGGEFLYFFDAIAPIIDADTINMDIAWKADRYDKGTPDYINCPMDKEQYEKFIAEITAARKIEPKHFEETPFFEGCMPIEVMVDRGPDTPRFGPMKPVGLKHPKTGREPWAVVQLRQDNKEATAYNMVGFQTRMAYGEQVRVFRMIPGLEEAEFLKLGSIHRNLYVNSPKLLNKDLSSKNDPWLFFAGQITGVEGYFESTCIGLLVAKFIDQKIQGKEISYPPRASAMGSLLEAITDPTRADHFQPTNINFGLFPNIDPPAGRKKWDKKSKKVKQLELAQAAMSEYLEL
jgi:methylenetetrahydrofolate--tRNA-(uracil-5-)-methyltransferase